MVDLVNTASDMFGGFNMSELWKMLSYGILAIVLIGISGFVVYKILMNKKYSKSITFFKKNASTGKYYPYISTKAMPIRFDDLGNIVYKLKKPIDTRNIIEKLNTEVRPNVHWVALGKDGKIIELEGISDIDPLRKEANITLGDSSSDLARSSMHTIRKQTYEKLKFLEKHAALLVNITAITVIMVFLWLITDKMISLLGQIGSLLKSAEALQIAQSNILNSLNNILGTSNLV